MKKRSEKAAAESSFFAVMSLEEAFGSVTPLQRPEDFALLREIARHERVEHILREMQDTSCTRLMAGSNGTHRTF